MTTEEIEAALERAKEVAADCEEGRLVQVACGLRKCNDARAMLHLHAQNIETYLTEVEKRFADAGQPVLADPSPLCLCPHVQAAMYYFRDTSKLTAMLLEALKAMKKHMHVYNIQNEQDGCDICTAAKRIEQIAGGEG